MKRYKQMRVEDSQLDRRRLAELLRNDDQFDVDELAEILKNVGEEDAFTVYEIAEELLVSGAAARVVIGAIEDWYEQRQLEAEEKVMSLESALRSLRELQ